MGLFSRKIENTGTQKLLVTVQPGETRIALTDSDLLVDLHIEQTSRERTVGNIYKGVVVKVNPAFQAAFIEYGEERNGFLSMSDVDPSLYKGNGQRGRPKIQSVLKTGQTLMVQVLKERIREKGAALTTAISLPGRYMVLTAHSDRSGISRRIGDADKRGKLKEVLAGLMGDDEKGVIIRTAGIDRKPAELKRDYANLQKEWKAIYARFEKQSKPGLLHQEPRSIIRVLRDYFSEEVSEVWVDTPEAYQEALKYFKVELPKFQKRLKFYVDEKSLFSSQGIEAQISALESSKVPLKSGGGLVIETTEALVAIDVNSGKSNQASDIEATALNTNLEAAEEVARQLRLRNLGGLIVVDFIDMMPQKNRERVEKVLADAMEDDKARISIGEISEFGLLELSRQRIDVELSRGMRTQCLACGGTGHVPTVNSSANNVMREIRAMAVSGRYQEIQGRLPLEHANFLLNERRESLRDLELEFDISIILTGDPTLPAGQAVRLTGSTAPGVAEAVEVASTARVDAPPDRGSRGTARAEAQTDRGSRGGASAEAQTDRGSRGGASAEAPAEGGSREGRPRRRRGRGRGRGGNGATANSGVTAGVTVESRGDEVPAPEKSGATEDADFAGMHDEYVEPEQQNDDRPVTSAPMKVPEEIPANGGAAPGNGGTPPILTGLVKATLPSLPKAKRGDWLAKVDSSHAAVGDTLYASAHKPVEQGVLPVILPSFKSSNPFAGREVEEGTTLFVSSHMGETRGEAAPAAVQTARPRRAPARGSGAKGGGKREQGASAARAPSATKGRGGASRARKQKPGGAE